MTTKRTRPAPEPVRLEMKQKSKDLMWDHRQGKPNLGQDIERALINAWKAGRDAAERGEADPDTSIEPTETLAVPAVKLGTKTKAVLHVYGLAAYGLRGEENREQHLCWRRTEIPFTGKKFWHLIALDGGYASEDSKGDASLKACVKLGLFKVGHLVDSDGNRLEEEFLVATPKTRQTYLNMWQR
jgi:hypothetical protein